MYIDVCWMMMHYKLHILLSSDELQRHVGTMLYVILLLSALIRLPLLLLLITMFLVDSYVFEIK